MIYNGDTMRKTEWTYSVLRDYKAPTGPKQMQRFLALGQYYGKYTEGYAKLVAPLRRLEKKPAGARTIWHLARLSTTCSCRSKSG